jgi:hypothetical protein
MGSIAETGLVLSLSYLGQGPVLVGGACGAETSTCRVTGTADPDHPRVGITWTLTWSGTAWQATVDREASWSDNQCRVEGGDFEPWAFSSMRQDLVGEVADWLEAVEWSCPD